MIDLTGVTIGRLTVLRETEERIGSSIVWECKCKCGKLGYISSRDLLHSGGKKRRGCGDCRDTSHPLYGTWQGIKSRCNDQFSASYKHYGGRGIKMDVEWQKDFLTFVQDVGPKPSPLHSIDRIDVNGDYTKDNCRWATTKEQANNKREAQEIPGYRGLKELDIIEIYKSKLSIEQLENKFGVARKTIQNIKSLNYSSWATQIIGTYLKLDQPHNVAAIKLATIKLKLKGEF